MNFFTTNRFTFAKRGAHAAMACAALTLPASAEGQSGAVATGGGGLRVLDVENLDDANVHGQSLEIRVENGKISARHNGKDIPADQIRAEGGRIIVLDENGEPLNDLNVFSGDGTGQFFIDAFGNAADWRGFQVQAQDGKTPPVMLGVTMSEPGKALEKHLRLKEGETTMISGVYAGLAADDAGLEEFDIITEVNGSGPADAASIRKILADAQPGQTISLTVIQAGKPKDLQVKLQKYDGEALAKSKLLGSGGAVWGWSGAGGQFPNQFTVPFDDTNSVFVAPEWNAKRFEQLQPKIQELLRQRIGESARGAKQGGADTTEQQLERLDKRMAELEALLERLVEKQGGAR